MKPKQAPAYGNVFSRIASFFTANANRRTPARRWIILLTLLVLWMVAGYITWASQGMGASETAYRTLGALTMIDAYTDRSMPLTLPLEAARFAGVAIPLVGVFFAFSGTLGRSLAQAFNAAAANHVVIAGSGEGALSLAQDCLKQGDSVFLIARGVSEETQWLLARRGGYVIEGDAARYETLKGARAHKAAHVVAFEEDEASNLQIEALMRRALAGERRRTPVAVHVATTSPGLLQEARDMRSQEQRKMDAKKDKSQPIDPRPFSLDEIAARALIQEHGATIAALAAARELERPHVVFFGFDDAADAVAVRIFVSLWSAKLQPPRVTVLAPDAESLSRRFQARYPQAFAHPGLYVADITFVPFISAERKIDRALLEEINQLRGPPCAVVVSAGSDSQNILLSLALKRTCNEDHFWPVPIFMHEATQSEFSMQYAKGDDTPEFDAYLQAFGAGQLTATRQYILEGRLDMAAAMHHQHYVQGMAGKESSMQELEAVARGWDDVRETYRDANRAGADAVMVRLWDAGWRPAGHGERPQTNAPAIPESMRRVMAMREHDRWMAERLFNGWRPGPQRDNTLRIHPNLTLWDSLSQDEQHRDDVQVRASIDVGRLLHPQGFMRME